MSGIHFDEHGVVRELPPSPQVRGPMLGLLFVITAISLAGQCGAFLVGRAHGYADGAAACVCICPEGSP